jgi:hypothetical protein
MSSNGATQSLRHVVDSFHKGASSSGKPMQGGNSSGKPMQGGKLKLVTSKVGFTPGKDWLDWKCQEEIQKAGRDGGGQ